MAPSLARLVVLVAAPACLAACLEGSDGRPAGEQCESAADCREPLVCAYGRCRSECTVDRDCPEGSACVAVSGGAGERVCTVEAEESCPEVPCPDGLVCSLAEGVCRDACPEGTECGPGRVCRDSVCIEGEEGGRTLLGLAAGYSWTCAWYDPGGARCWGQNDDGQLGDGTIEDRTVPISVVGLEGRRVVQMAAGRDHTCAVLADGTVLCWGDNYSRQLGQRAATSAAEPMLVPGVTGARAIACGEAHTCVALEDGSAACWGAGDRGQLGDGGEMTLVDPVRFGTVAGSAAAAAGEGHTCVLTDAGSVWCAGWNFYGQLGDGTGAGGLGPVEVSGVVTAVALTAREWHSCALLSDDSAACWGSNSYGQLGNGETSDAVRLPVAVASLEGVRAISAGTHHTCAARRDGLVACWGDNNYGQLGDGSRTSRLTPGLVPGLADIVGVAAGYDHICAWNAAGEAWCWGWNTFGQLGNGATLDEHEPVPVLL